MKKALSAMDSIATCFLEFARAYVYGVIFCALIFPILLFLASCATTRPVPAALLTCKEEPVYGKRKAVSAADLLEFTDQVAVAGADCRARLKAVKKIVDQK